MDKRRFIVCQIGAREHYVVPRTLHRADLLAELITDVWAPPGSILRHFPGSPGERLRGRYHPKLGDAMVMGFTRSALGREAMTVMFGKKFRWDHMMGHNRWFQAAAVRHLRSSGVLEGEGSRPVVLAYSYAARRILEHARDAGAMTVLCQIDGGIADEKLIDSLWSKRKGSMPDKAPSAYWEDWQEECRIADRIMVNSEWSRQLLVEVGIEVAKLTVIPVIYEPEDADTSTRHQYAASFNAARPLKILFLGALTLRKGVLEALEAARALASKPVHFTFVGSDSEGHGALLEREHNVTRHDRVPRSHVMRYYKNADVFLFPTHSDGFGMTQIEALSSGLPVIASRNCASIIEHGRTGLLLGEVSADAIVRAISECLDDPAMLADMSAAALATGTAFRDQSRTTFLDAMREFGAREPR